MISRIHRCIFVHIPKTGGTSIESIIWPDREKRTTADLYMGLVDRFSNKYQTGGLQHLLARQIRQEVGDAVFNEYFKFAIVRNPWDRAVSQYVYMSKRADLRRYIGMRQGATFKEYLGLIRQKMHVQWEPQINFLRDTDGTNLVDYVGRFETFNDSVNEILSKIGITSAEIPHEKKGSRGSYHDYYDDESIETVAKFYADDISEFGYNFS